MRMSRSTLLRSFLLSTGLPEQQQKGKNKKILSIRTALVNGGILFYLFIFYFFLKKSISIAVRNSFNKSHTKSKVRVVC